MVHLSLFFLFFFFNDTATTEIYTLSLHDALPIYGDRVGAADRRLRRRPHALGHARPSDRRSEEHTSELQSPDHLVCRLLLEKKKQKTNATELSPLQSNSHQPPPASSLTNPTIPIP